MIMSFFSLIFGHIQAIGFVLFSLIFPSSYRKDFLYRHADRTNPLLTTLLFPGSRRETKKQPVWNKPLKKRMQSCIILFGGNNETQESAIEVLTGLKLEHGEFLEKATLPLLSFPLLKAKSEEDYCKQVEQIILDQTHSHIKHIHLVGHSLGGAIALQVACLLTRQNPKLQITLYLDRTFDRLTGPVQHLYGSFIRKLLERTFGLLWTFRSDLALEELALNPLVRVIGIQVIPDHVIGQAFLCTVLHKIGRGDWQSYVLHRSCPVCLHRFSLKRLAIPYA